MPANNRNPLEELANDPRVTVRTKRDPREGKCVVYWMQRSQRVLDNAALDVAVAAANRLGLPIVTFFAPVPFYPHANLRHYTFLAQGIPDIAEGCEKRNIGFVLRRYPEHSLIRFCEEVFPALVVGDENPLRETEHWREIAARKLQAPLWTVDSDVCVPSKLIPPRQYAARTIRPRLNKLLSQFLVPFANESAQHEWKRPSKLKSLPRDFDILKEWEKLDRSVCPVESFRGGTSEALKRLDQFVKIRLKDYDTQRNHPELAGTSELSPYLHFGHIGPVTVALAVKKAKASADQKERFLDQLITWRELSINFVRSNPATYDSFECAEAWAHRTLAEHARDKRPVLYTEQQLERAETYDELWNAAQRQMVNHGWMHNYMRMYWAKKILEWTKSPQQAFQITMKLNDKYFLDGRDPNGYAGVAWSIAGKFDRPWFEREIFGKVRYMSGASTGKKFNSKEYIRQNAPEEQASAS